MSGFTISSLAVVLVVAAMMALVGGSAGSRVRGAEAAAARVTAVTQITHDGFRKENLLADDGQIYVTEMPATNRVIAKVRLPDANRSVVEGKLASMQALDVSADGTRLLVSARAADSGENQFWMMPAAGGAAERVGELSGRDASWSRDGKQLVFAKGAIVYVADGAGGEGRQVYGASGSVFGLRFSPDGQRIRFTVSDLEQNTTALWEVGRDGSNAHALLGEWRYKSSACCGSWTADGRYYIFQASENVPNTAIVISSLWALAESGRENVPVQITNGPMSFGNASLGRDSKKIWAIGVEPAAEVVKCDGKKKECEPLVAGLSATDVEFSADGKWIAYVSVPDGALWRARADGSERVRLTPDAERAALPHWSPDGKQIAYAGAKPGGRWKLSLVSANGGDGHELVPESGSQIDANWSADGEQLMFGDVVADAVGNQNALKIRVMNFKTHEIRTIPGSDGLFSPRWSPNGRYIAALTPDFKRLMLFDFKSEKWTTWLKGAEHVAYPSWSKDSQSLYFDDFVTGAEAIRRLKVGGSDAELVLEVGSFDRYSGALGLWNGRAADGSWMFVRDRSTQEVYQLTVELP